MGGTGVGMIPRGVGAPPPPGMDPRKGKLMCIKVRMLDDTVGVFHLGHRAHGQALHGEVCRHLNLLECDYFGLEFIDCFGNKCWLDKEKPILRQIALTQSNARFYFIAKFYTPNPSDLEEEYTRYLFALQIKRDLASGELICNENTAALLASYIVQSDCGDFSVEDYPDHTYLSSANFIPNQSANFQRKVMENHSKIIGMSPGESDMALLETARRCDFYGVKMHPAKDVEGADVSLAAMHMGIRVFHLLQCVSTFSWAKIRKLSFKRRKLLIKLHPESYQYYKETIEFSFDGRNICKNFWKKCVEHHAFFRCSEVSRRKKGREGRFFSRGSSFKYIGRTQKQMIDYVREHRKHREPFARPLKPSGSKQERLLNPQFLSDNDYSFVGHKLQSISFDETHSKQSRNVKTHGAVSQTQTVNGGRISAASYANVNTKNTSQITVASSQLIRLPDAYQAATKADGDRMCISDMESSVYNEQRTYDSSRYRPVSKPVSTKNHVGNETVSPDAQTSLSLPNVLGEDVQLVCREFELKGKHPPKSASGDNFLGQTPNDYDNVSEGSYRLSDFEQCSAHLDAPSNNPIYSTTFTTKRVGDVIVKKVISSNPTHSMKSNSSASKVSQDCSNKYASGRENENCRIADSEKCQQRYSSPLAMKAHENRCIVYDDQCSITSSAPSSFAEYPVHKKLIPVEIDGPNVKLDEYRKRINQNEATLIGESKETFKRSITQQSRSVIYTSRGAILQKPKVIPDVYAYRTTGRKEDNNTLNTSVLYSQNNSNTIAKTYGAVGPLPGKVITRENLMITPTGVCERKPKPVVPPKPKVLKSPSSPNESSLMSSINIRDPVVNFQDRKCSDMTSTVLSEIEEALKRPILISVQSEDEPNVQRCHLFNSDIPYVLTMRNVSYDSVATKETSTLSIFKEANKSTASVVEDDETRSGSLRTCKKKRTPDECKRRKSLDLVPRKRLPSPGSYSSQDHSISPTTPESGDILEYILKRRSNCDEKSLLKQNSKRNDQRRQTQPVRFKLADSPCVENQNASSLSEPNLIDEINGNDKDTTTEADVHFRPDKKEISIASTAQNVRQPSDSSECGKESVAELQQPVCEEKNKLHQGDESGEHSSTVAVDEESVDCDEFPPPPSTSSLLILSSQKLEVIYQNISNLPPIPPALASSNSVVQCVDTIPFVDDSLSSKASLTSKEDLNETNYRKITASSSTLCTPTGVLWTDF